MDSEVIDSGGNVILSQLENGTAGGPILVL